MSSRRRLNHRLTDAFAASPEPRVGAVSALFGGTAGSTDHFRRIPIDRISATPAVIYDSATHWLNSSPGEDVPHTPPEHEFSPFDPATYRELTEVPALHEDYLRRQQKLGKLALGFVFVRHVLVAGPVDVSGIDPVPL